MMRNDTVTTALLINSLDRLQHIHPFDAPEFGAWGGQLRALRRVLAADAGAVTDQTRVAVCRALLGVARDSRSAEFKRPRRDELHDYESLVGVICDLQGALEARGGR